ncbi:uncharacterized protein LOC127736656 [Mytilus californianus]|uniref:uncharacterized protein LOC127736656 n=1 Tax=Mytilus californianus TaxID=6549 RepID=UPI002245C051|nr:uncharacterized protein LOC127736656 [Mytilus californianus]
MHIRGHIEFYCCDNHEEINGTCVECRDGYISESGEVCQQCKSRSYGRKCVYLCTCSVNKRCDHIHGCVEIIDDTTTARSDSKTQAKYKYHTTETIRSTRNIHVGSSTIGLFPFGLSKREVIVYSIGIGGCSIGVLICIAFFRRHKSRSVRQTVETIEPFQNNSMIMNELPVDRIENLYETIDESTMELELNSTVNQSEHNLSGGSESDQTNSLSTSSKSSDSNDITSIGNNSYLNPYQPIVSDTDPHVYISTYKPSEEFLNTSSEEKDSISNHKNSFQELFEDSEQKEDCNTEKGSKRSSE